MCCWCKELHLSTPNLLCLRVMLCEAVAESSLPFTVIFEHFTMQELGSAIGAAIARHSSLPGFPYARTWPLPSKFPISIEQHPVSDNPEHILPVAASSTLRSPCLSTHGNLHYCSKQSLKSFAVVPFMLEMHRRGRRQSNGFCTHFFAT